MIGQRSRIRAGLQLLAHLPRSTDVVVCASRDSNRLTNVTYSAMSQLFPPPPSHPSRRPSPATPPRFVAPPARNLEAEHPVASAPQLSANSPPTPPLPPRPELPHTQSMPGSVDPLADDDSSSDDGGITIDEPLEEVELSEGRLRELYDEEEIDRFLHLFSAVSYSSLSCHRCSSNVFVVCQRGPNTTKSERVQARPISECLWRRGRDYR